MPEAVLNPEDRSVPAVDSPAATKPNRGRVWRRTAGAWLCVATAYWLGMFAGTHTAIDGPIPNSLWEWDADKLVHALAYFGLTTVLLIAWRRTGAYPGLRGRLAVAAVALAYGAIDELTQPFVGRQCELFDWLADAAGVFSAIAIDTWRHRRK